MSIHMKKKTPLPTQTPALLKRLYREFIAHYIPLLLWVVALLFVISGSTSIQPILLQQTFDRVFKAHDTTALTLLPIAIVISCSVQAAATYYTAILMTKFSSNLTADMRSRFYQHLIENEIDFYAEHDSGTLMSRVIGEISGIVNAVQMFFNSWARQFITSVGLISVMLYQSVQLTCISLAALLIAFYPIRNITRKLKKIARDTSEQNGQLYSRLMESFQGIRLIKSYGKEDREIQKINEYINAVRRLSNKMGRVGSLTPALMQCLAGFAVAGVIWYGGYELLNNKMTEGQLIAFITSLLMVSRPIRSLTSGSGMATTGIVYTERFYTIMDTKPKYASRDEGIPLQVQGGRIVFDQVSFAYPSGVTALEQVSFSMEAGQKTALVGHSGSGKSTIFNLLLKFYDPQSGSITIDGQNLTHASIRSARGSMALVSQDIFIFDDTARGNISYGREGATEEEIIAAAKAAKCHDFIMNLPQGYDTNLGFFGQNLSGGQKQRIAIARAFLRNAPILLLDEATSALDPKTEAEIQESIELLTRNRTTIIIAHRLSTVMKADRMILMEGGNVRAISTHDDLLANCPPYRELFGI